MPSKKYTKEKPILHILKRPDMYVGSIRLRKSIEYIAEKNSDTGYKIIKKEIKTSPAILRIFVEALSNAVDNVERSRKTKTPCTTIKVNINEDTGETSVWNDGDVIPIEINEDEKCYNHSLVFGQLLTGSNYNDEEERIISGRNGLGIKLCSVFSTKFQVEGVDPVNKKYLFQEWSNNMQTTTPPKVTKSIKKGYTKVTWFPDFSKFGLKKYTKDIIALYYKYVLDAAMLCKINVYLNGKLIPVKTLLQYSKLYSGSNNENLFIKTKNCEVLLTSSTSEFEHISFVNGVYTKLGGCHVDSWSEAFFRPIVDKFNGKGKKTKTKTPKININDVKRFFKIFVVSTVIRPEFNGQEKHCLESPEVKATVKKTHLNTIYKWSSIDNIENIIRAKEMIVLKKSEKKRKVVKIDGLDPANNAGTKYSEDCSLIICEGLSAKTYAVAGIKEGLYGKKGRDWFGILPLTGKVLNVRNATPSAIGKNKVITNLIQALGARFNVDYTKDSNFKTLDYGKVILLADSDCFTGDTPLLIRKNNKVDIISIENLYFKKDDNKEIEIWSDNGWTKMLEIKQKNTDKKILEISSHCGIISCTEDHKFLLEDKSVIKASELKEGNKLLQTKRVFNGKFCKEIDYEIKDNISILEAFLWGAFFNKGSCYFIKKSWKNYFNSSKEKYHWSISNHNLRFLLKIKDILKICYPNLEWCIEEKYIGKCQDGFKIFLSDGKDISKFINKMIDRFYDKENKKVPFEILNASIIVQKQFIKGYDASIYCKNLKENEDFCDFNIRGQIGAQGLCFLGERLGYNVSVEKRDCNIYSITLSKYYSKDLNKIHSIKVKKNQSVVYDIETENHHLNAGVGGLVVHNCDGLHIEGLVVNFFHSLFPSLLERKEPYIISMKTPIARIKQGRKNDILFYDERNFNNWILKQSKKLNVKYYKGLGTTKPEDVPDTFGMKVVEYNNDENTVQNMNKVFLKKYTDARKEWLGNYNPSKETFSLDKVGKVHKMNISDFIDFEMIKFSHSDCGRSIPNGIDGLKESQRKILYAVKKRKLKYSGKSLKVAQLSGYTAEHSNYHHGEQNLQDTIVNLAHDFVGSNNIPLLYRDGMFGTRISFGDDAASARYIYTKMDMLTDLIFKDEDEPLLKQVNDDGDLVQPEHYIPIIPMILVNGCKAGIGTGWSCNIPCYNPLELVEAVKEWLKNKGKILTKEEDGSTISLLSELNPWYRGFKGEIKKDEDNRYITYGIYNKIGRNKVEVTELPIGMSTDKFKDYCEDLLQEKQLKSIKNYSTTKEVKFVLTESRDGITCNFNTLKLHSYVYTSNMVLFNDKQQLKKYESVDEIIDTYCKVRYLYYKKRKEYQIKVLEEELQYIGNKERFISEIINEELIIMNEKESDLIEELELRDYDKDPKKEEGGYDYLLRMPVRTFTAEKVKKLQDDILCLETKLDKIRKTSEKKMWLNELDEFVKEYKKFLKLMK